MKITYDQLVKYDACEKQRELFKETFGDSVVITEDIAKKYYKVFDFLWVINCLFPKEAYEKYYQDRNSLDSKYIKDRKPIDDKYEQDCNSLYNKHLYDKAMIFYKYSLTID